MASDGRAANEARIASPDGSVQCRVFLHEARLKYASHLQQQAGDRGIAVAVFVDGVDLAEGAEVGRMESYQVNDTYPWRGVHSQAVNHCKGAKISLKHAKSNTSSRWRSGRSMMALPSAISFPATRIHGCRTRPPTFVIPAGSTVWYHDLEGHYEGVHDKNDIADVRAGQWVAPPLTFKLPGGVRLCLDY